MESPLKTVRIYPHEDEKERYLVHERTSFLPGERTYPSFPYAWFSDNSGFFSCSENAFSEPRNSDYVVRYIYRMREPIEMIDAREDAAYEISPWLRHIFPENKWSNEEWGDEEIIGCPEAAFLLQVLGYSGIYYGSDIILSEKVYDTLELYSVLEFNKDSLSTTPAHQQIASEPNVCYSSSEISTLRTRFSPYLV